MVLFFSKHWNLESKRHSAQQKHQTKQSFGHQPPALFLGPLPLFSRPPERPRARGSRSRRWKTSFRREPGAVERSPLSRRMLPVDRSPPRPTRAVFPGPPRRQSPLFSLVLGSTSHKAIRVVLSLSSASRKTVTCHSPRGCGGEPSILTFLFGSKGP